MWFDGRLVNKILTKEKKTFLAGNVVRLQIGPYKVVLFVDCLRETGECSITGNYCTRRTIKTG